MGGTQNNVVTQLLFLNVAVRIVGTECKVKTMVVAYLTYSSFVDVIKFAELHARKSRKTSVQAKPVYSKLRAGI